MFVKWQMGLLHIVQNPREWTWRNDLVMPFQITPRLQSLCNNLFSGATRPMCFYDTIKWIHLLRSCSCDDLTSCCRSIREMLCLNWIKFSSCRDSLSSATSRSTPHSLPYIQLNAPVTCTFSLDWTCRDVAAHLPPPQPESDDQPP